MWQFLPLLFPGRADRPAEDMSPFDSRSATEKKCCQREAKQRRRPNIPTTCLENLIILLKCATRRWDSSIVTWKRLCITHMVSLRFDVNLRDRRLQPSQALLAPRHPIPPVRKPTSSRCHERRRTTVRTTPCMVSSQIKFLNQHAKCFFALLTSQRHENKDQHKDHRGPGVLLSCEP